VKDADVQTNGDLRSGVPSGELFGLDGSGGYPGVPAYGGSTNLTNTNVSEKGWIAKSPYVITNNRIYNYDFFESLIPAETTINSITSSSVAGSYFNTGNIDPGSGYYWYKYESSLPLTISSAVNLAGSRKVILLVDSPNLYLNGSINYTAGTGFFMVMVKGNINVGSSVGGSGVADLQGYYSADSSFVTGTGNKQLYVKGSVAGYGGITLQRDLGAAVNADTPAEIFEYSPADVFLYPFKLGVRKMSWKEVAP